MAVMGYNRQNPIGYATDRALLQDCDGLVASVLSDDCSSNGSFDVMRQKAKACRENFHLRLNRNETGSGYSGNLMKAAG